MINFRAKALRKRHGKLSGTRDIYAVWTEPGEIRPPRCLILCVFHSKLKDFSLAVTKLFQSSPEDLVLHDTASFLPFSSSFSPVLQHSICCFFLHCPNSHFITIQLSFWISAKSMAHIQATYKRNQIVSFKMANHRMCTFMCHSETDYYTTIG